jgi:DNA-binding NarL/FixJ family response regulator
MVTIEMALIPITISIGGGHELDRAGLAALIANLPALHVVPIDDNPPPQVLLWNLCTDLAELPLTKPGTKILLLTESTEEDSLPDTVHGLFSKDESPSALATAIRQVARGDQYLSPELATAILQKHQSMAPTPELQVLDELTSREQEILDLLAQGLSNKMIASRLYLSLRTVEGHLANMYSRLGVHSRTEAMLMAVKAPKSGGLRHGTESAHIGTVVR